MRVRSRKRQDMDFDSNEDGGIFRYENYEEAREALLEFAKDNQVIHRYIKEISPEEMGQVLFFGQGEDILIQGMHYQDDALDLSVVPNIFPGAEEGTIIAAFPDTLVKALLQTVEERYDEEYRPMVWQKILGAMLEAVVEILDGNEIPEFKPEKLL